MDINMDIKKNSKFEIRNSKSNHGAALLITMLLIAGVGSLALAVSRIVLSEIRISSAYADGIVAYQAAEAGIERGLLEFRFNRSIEQTFPFEKLNDDTGAGYNLNISYKDSDGTITGNLAKDEVAEFDISNISSTIAIGWNGDTGWIEWILLGEEQSDRGLIPSSSTPSTGAVGSVPTIGNWSTLKIKYISQVNNAALSYSISSYNLEPFDTGTTKVESTGTFGKTRRKLVAKIDRKTGTILGIFDYTLYAGTGDISP